MAAHRLLPAFTTSLSVLLRRSPPSLTPQRPHAPFRLTPFCSMAQPPLPTIATIQSASFMQAVPHAEAVLRSYSIAPNSDTLSLLEALLSTDNGSRAFFITFLADEEVLLADEMSPEVRSAIMNASAQGVKDLLAKNLVMSATMVVHYGRTGEQEKKQSSESTHRRSRNVAKAVMDDGLKSVLEEMLEGVEKRKGRFEPFLSKWGYDAVQREQAAEGLRYVLGM